MKLKKAIAVLLLLSFILSMSLIPSFSASAQSEAQSFLDEQMEANNLTCVFYVTKNGEVLCQGARGMANTAEGKEMTIDTLFPIGSNSKQFCAAAILLLQEQGKLSVDDTISMYFPEYTRAKDVTIKNLLTMRSGIIDHYTDGYLAGKYTLSVTATSEENKTVIFDWLCSKATIFSPDNRAKYSNSNYFLLSLIVEKVSGQKYTDFIKDNIFSPLGMANSGFYEELLNHPNLAAHTTTEENAIVPKLKGLTQGCGDLVSNAKDMDKWMTSLREYTLLSKESVTEMTTCQSKDSNYGYGVGIIENGGVLHVGGIVSYLSATLHYPDDSFNIFAVSNDYDTGLSGIIEALTFELAEKFNTQGIYGDVNGDEKVNVKDATLIQKSAAKLITLEGNELIAADVNLDTKVNVKDATAIQKFAAKIETNLPIGDSI